LKSLQAIDSLKIDETIPTPNEKSFLVCNAELSGFMADHLDFVSFFALVSANQMRIPSSKIIHLPTETIKWHTVKGPFVHAKTKEVFERQTHKRLLQLFDTHQDTVKEWIRYLNENLPNGVDLKVERFEWSSLDFNSELLQETPKDELLRKKNRAQLIIESADQYIKLFSAVGVKNK
jgi:ribosomal protein S10